ncbi:DNA-directed primase/polymerase protein isoform X2 [Myripristis murdjan]|uniref:DNA-directed primase/polymerase protein n=1 Tax=Myripristis murdjan TaxID=586833 RepID=A0A667YL48_9TELE|nr:DNA-directed primase/polymerase protein isoform X2 [Myripristis murdjan]
MKKWGDRLKKVEQLAQSFQQSPLATPYKPRLWLCQPSSVWKVFPRQSVAISFAQSCREAVHVFALEKEQAAPGQRIYLVTSYSELWHYYKTYRQSLMHCYEVITEAAVCKLYFDLEFHSPSNQKLDGKTMVSFFIQYVCEKLLEVYGVKCTAKDVLNLDSSTEEKFSRHLIFVLSNAAFKDNIHAGRFVHAILQQVLSTKKSKSHTDVDVNSVQEDSAARTHALPVENPAEADSPQAKRQRREERDLSFLMVKNKEGQECLFVDLGVYTKNRNFRLYKSTKVGKNAAFSVAEDNKFIAKPEKNISAEESLFLASLICNVSFTGQRILTWDVPNTKDSKAAAPQCKPGTTTAGSFGGHLSSPYQEVDNFVLSVVKKDGVEGSIRRWNYFVSQHLLVYDIANYRWCENVGRPHRSNNIMILVDLQEEVWYQKCHDPACKNFRSSSYPLPQEICVSYLMALDEDDQAFLMDDTGNIELSQTPNQAEDSAADPEEAEGAEWGDGQDDQACLEALEDFERQTEEIPDQLLLQCVADFDSS